MAKASVKRDAKGSAKSRPTSSAAKGKSSARPSTTRATKSAVAKPAARAKVPTAKTAVPAKSKANAKAKVASVRPEPAKVAARGVEAASRTSNAKRPAATLKPASKVANSGQSVAAAVKPSKVAPAAIEAPKPTGRPMLSQGPFTGSTLTKKGTFAPNKLATPAPKLARRRVERPEPVYTPPPPPTPAVATSEKAQKNRAGLSQKDLEFFRDLLLAKRRELLGDMSSMEREALREGTGDLSTLPIHMADQGTDAYEQEFTLRLVEDERGLLREINNALAKIQNGTYGVCEGTGLPISKARLEAQPWAKYSIEHARALEKKQMMFRR